MSHEVVELSEYERIVRKDCSVFRIVVKLVYDHYDPCLTAVPIAECTSEEAAEAAFRLMTEV